MQGDWNAKKTMKNMKKVFNIKNNSESEKVKQIQKVKNMNNIKNIKKMKQMEKKRETWRTSKREFWNWGRRRERQIDREWVKKRDRIIFTLLRLTHASAADSYVSAQR